MNKSAHKQGSPQRKLVKLTSLSAWTMIAALSASNAYAQSDAPEIDATNQPVAASTSVTLEPQLSQKLPEDMMPEELSAPKTTDIDPNLERETRFFDRNSWDPSILTQSTGLSAVSLQPDQQQLENPSESSEAVGKGVLASDLMSAEDLLNVGNIDLPDLSAGFAAPPRNDGVISLNTPIRETLFDSPTEGINASVFKLDLGDRLCLGTAEECEANRIESIDVGYAKNITHGKYDGLNLQLTPRAGLRFDGDSKSALVGALVRVGDNLREGSEMKSNTWYFFAGADAEAVTYTPTGVRRLTSGEFHLQDRIIVGDAQAGLGYRLGTADLALTYYKRQAKAENYSYDEDAAALSLTWRR